MTNHAPGSELILGLQRATHATLHELTAQLADLDLLPSEINALANLAPGPVPVGALATATAIRKTTLTSVLDRLTRRGYVARDLDPGDRRSFVVSLTPAGREAAAAITTAISDVEQQALARVSTAERAGFQAVIRALTEVFP